MGEARTEKVLQDLNDRASTVLQQYVQTSSADESVSVPLRGSDSAELVAGDSGRGKHKWLVYSSVGDSTDAWRSWLPGRDFDILINYHGRKGQAPEEMTEAVEMVQQRKGGKFASLQHFQNGGRLDQYEAIMVLDDDIVLDPKEIHLLFNLRRAYNLTVVAPTQRTSLSQLTGRGRCRGSHDSHQAHGSCFPVYGLENAKQLRIVDFIEENMPIFQTEFLLSFLAVLDPTVVGWGVDIWYSWMSQNRSKGRMALVDSVSACNPKNWNQPRDIAVNFGDDKFREEKWRVVSAQRGVPFHAPANRNERTAHQTTLLAVDCGMDRISPGGCMRCGSHHWCGGDCVWDPAPMMGAGMCVARISPNGLSQLDRCSLKERKVAEVAGYAASVTLKPKPLRVAWLISGSLHRFNPNMWKHLALDQFVKVLKAKANIELEVFMVLQTNMDQAFNGAIDKRSGNQDAIVASIREQFEPTLKVNIELVHLGLNDDEDGAFGDTLHQLQKLIREPELDSVRKHWTTGCDPQASTRSECTRPANNRRWKQNFRMMYLRHKVYANALQSQVANDFFLYTREDNMFMAVPPAVLHFVPTARPTIVVDTFCGWGGMPDKIFFADRQGADTLFGKNAPGFVRNMFVWVRTSQKIAAKWPEDNTRMGFVDVPFQTESFYNSLMRMRSSGNKHGIASVQEADFYRTEVRTVNGDVCIPQLYKQCHAKWITKALLWKQKMGYCPKQGKTVFQQRLSKYKEEHQKLSKPRKIRLRFA